MSLLLILLASLLSCGGQLCQKQAAHHGLQKGKGHLLIWLGLSVLLLGVGRALACRRRVGHGGSLARRLFVP